ncbi:hypothetical protein GCM10027168_44560 [Streptomyces capparidis]
MHEHHLAPADTAPRGHQAAPPAAPLSGTVELAADRASMVWVPGPDGTFVAVPRHTLPDGYLHPPAMPAPQPRDLTPAPLVDPRAQLALAGGIGAGAAGAGIGFGIGQAAAGIAAVSGSSALVVVLALLLLTKLTSRGGDRVTVHHETTVINHNRWWGRSSSSVRH